MKLHLPIALLAAVMLSNTGVYANGVYTVTETDTITINTGETQKVSENTEIYGQLSKDGYTVPSDDLNPHAILKAGEGTLVIDKSVTMNNPFVIDQGEVKIENATVTSHRTSANFTSCLSIGEAKLTMDNGHFTQTGAGTYAICIGNRDGAATLNMSNGSTMTTNHYIFAGYTGSQTTDYRVGIDAAGADNVAVSTININSGSKLTAGTSLQFANVHVNIDGEGSVLADNGINSEKNIWPDSYIGYGYERDVQINVTNGGKLDLNWNAYTATGHDSKVVINVSGKDAESGTASSMDVAGVLHLSSTADYDRTNSDGSNYDATTELNITDGAKASINQLDMGMDAGKATVNIGSNSTYTGKEVTVGANGSFTNNGTVTLSSGSVTEWFSDGEKNYGSQEVSKEGALIIDGGTVINNKTMTVQKLEMSAGTVNNDKTGEVITSNGLLKNSGTFNVKKDASIENSTIVNEKNNLTFSQNVNVAGSTIQVDAGQISFSSKTGTLYADKDTVFENNGGTMRIGNQYSVTSDTHTYLLTSDGAKFINNAGTYYFHGDVKANEGTEFIANKGTMNFEGTVEMSGTTVTKPENRTGTGNVNFKGDVILKGGNTFTSSSGEISFSKSLTTDGDNTFNGGVNIKNMVVNSGTQVFDQFENTQAPSATQNLIFNNISKTDDAYIKVVADALGRVSFSGDSEISELVYDTASSLEIRGSLTVTDVMVLSGNMSYNSAGDEIGITPVSFIVSDIENVPTLKYLGDAENLTIDDGTVFNLVFDKTAIEQMINSDNNFEIALNLFEGEVFDNMDITVNLDVVSNSYGVDASTLFGKDTLTVTGGSTTVLRSIPEPTTATLSLLALAALAARRRRR